MGRAVLCMILGVCVLSAIRPLEAVADEEEAKVALERERFGLERAKLQLERDRLEHDKRVAASKVSNWYGWPPLAALLGAVVTWFLTRTNEREKARRELLATFDQELRKGRIDAYRKLWLQLKPLSLYGGGGFKRDDAGKLRMELRNWYFGNGMFLSGRKHGTRDRYFALQNALVLVSTRTGVPDVLATAEDQITHKMAETDEKDVASFDKYADKLPDTAKETPYHEYRFLRALGSLLRTACVDDVQTRAAAIDIRSGVA